jgi:hypothetical protein
MNSPTPTEGHPRQPFSAMPDIKHASLDGRLVIIGFSSIGHGVLPLILRHIAIAPQNITIVTAEPRGNSVAEHYGVKFIETPLLSTKKFWLERSPSAAATVIAAPDGSPLSDTRFRPVLAKDGPLHNRPHSGRQTTGV